MPGQLDPVLRPVASQLVTAFGKAATLTRVTLTQDQATGTSSETSTTESVIVTPPEPYNRHKFPGITAENVESVASVAGQDVAEPAINDRLTFDGTIHQIIDVNRIYSGQLVALYELGLRT